MANGLSQHQLITLKNKIIRQQSLTHWLKKDGLFFHRTQKHQYAATISNAYKSPGGQAIKVNIKPMKKYFDALLEMDAALIKMENNTYGICVDCKKHIGFERLNHYPISSRCLQC
jgi:RNA polymerase-binding transcription factor DksA